MKLWKKILGWSLTAIAVLGTASAAAEIEPPFTWKGKGVASFIAEYGIDEIQFTLEVSVDAEGQIKVIGTVKFPGAPPMPPAAFAGWVAEIDFIIVGDPGESTPIAIDGATSVVTIQPLTKSLLPRDSADGEENFTAGSITITAPPTTWTLSPKPVAHGDVLVGAQGTQQVTIANTGGEGLFVQAIALTGDAQFSLDLGGFVVPGTVGAGANLLIDVLFDPDAMADFTGKLKVTTLNGAPSAADSANVTGRGVLPDIAAAALDFGDVVKDQTDQQNLVIQNTGTADLTVTDVVVTNTAGGVFALAAAFVGPVVIAPSTSANVAIDATPDDFLVFNGTVQITSDDPDESPLDVALTVRGILGPTTWTFTPQPVAFGDVEVGQVATQQMTVTNTGANDLQLDPGAVVLTGDGAFSLNNVPGLPALIASGNTFQFDVDFQPGARGGFTGEVKVTTVNAGADSADVSGTGVQQDIDVASPLAFGTVFVGQSSTQNLVIANVGDMDLTVADVVITNTAGGAYALVTDPFVGPVVIATGNSINVAIQYTPPDLAVHNGVVQITSDDPDESPLNVNLTGTGALDVTIPATVNFGAVRQLDSKTMYVIIQNNGPVALNLLNIVLPGAPFAATTETATIAAGTSDTAFTIVFTPPLLQPYAAQITFDTNDPTRQGVVIDLMGVGSLYTSISVDPSTGKVLVDASGPYDALIPVAFLTLQFTATGTLEGGGGTEDATAAAVWTSSDPLTATVLAGLADGLLPGTVTITAAVGDKDDTATLQVVQLGDVNADGAVNVADILLMIDHIIHRAILGTPFAVAAADRNADGNNDVLDPAKALVIDILGGPLGGVPKWIAGPAMVAVPHEVLPSNGVVSVPMGVQAAGSFAAMQVEVRYDAESLSPVGVRLTDRSDGMEVAYHAVDGVLHALVYSLTGETIQPGASPVLDLAFERIGDGTGDTDLTFAQTILVDSAGEAIPVRMDRDLVSVGSLPEQYGLAQNHPNPFNPETTIGYMLPASGDVVLEVFGVNGQLVARLVDGYREAGRYEVRWDGRNLSGQEVSSGVYVYRIRSGDFTKIRRMMLLK